MNPHVLLMFCCSVFFIADAMELSDPHWSNACKVICKASENAQKAFSMFQDSDDNKEQTFITDALHLYNGVKQQQEDCIGCVDKKDITTMALLIDDTSSKDLFNGSTTAISSDQLASIVSFADYLNCNDTTLKNMILNVVNDADRYPFLSDMYKKFQIFTNAQDLSLHLINRELKILSTNNSKEAIRLKIEIPESIQSLKGFENLDSRIKAKILPKIFGRRDIILLDNQTHQYKPDLFYIELTLHTLSIIKKLFELLHTDGTSCRVAKITYANKIIDIDELLCLMPNLERIIFDKCSFEKMYASRKYYSITTVGFIQDYIEKKGPFEYEKIFPRANFFYHAE